MTMTLNETWIDLPTPEAARIPEEDQVFAIGDVHGSAQVLEDALAAIARRPRQGRRELVFLGDLVDRGPESIRCLALIDEAAERAKVDKVTFLPGNHEILLAQAIAGSTVATNIWLGNGGQAVLEEANLTSMEFLCVPGTRRRLDDEIARRSGMRIGDRLQAAPSHRKIGNTIFVHAGLSPDEEPERFLAQHYTQIQDHHWSWIRQSFMKIHDPIPSFWPGMIVHGHTAETSARNLHADRLQHFTTRALSRRRAINIDFGGAWRDRVGIAEITADRMHVGFVEP